MKNYYDLLEIGANAPHEDIKRAFRQQIARYHPDKVQHLGKEFQDMAASRAAALTEAYRVLSHEQRRAEYDAARGEDPGVPPAVVPAAAASAPCVESPRPDPAQPTGERRTGQFVTERASADAFVRKAIVDRFRQAFAKVAANGYDESNVGGFDIAWIPKAKLFGRSKGPRILGRFVVQVDAAAVAETWMQAAKWSVPPDGEVCVLLMGMAVAGPRELSDAIAEQRRRPARGAKVTVIPVNASIWDAHVPTDAPGVAKDLLVWLRSNA